MSKSDTMLRNLCKQLGDKYCIRTIDLERCLYRDFGNGFNVEISGVHTTSTRKHANLYLWFGEGPCMIVRSVMNVARDDIARTVDELYDYTEQLIRDGLDNWDALIHWMLKDSEHHTESHDACRTV